MLHFALGLFIFMLKNFTLWTLPDVLICFVIRH